MNKQQSLQLEPMRHSAEHILTMAMLKIWPGKIKPAMGPATAEGFYFDFDTDLKISEDDFEKIEKEMAEIIKADLPITQQKMAVAKARDLFKGNEYREEWLNEIEAKGEQASVYIIGDLGKNGFADLCAGPHVESTGKIGAFKLLKIAGAYWRGDEKNKMLIRIYGTAFAKKKELTDYLKMIEEAKKRDHRVLGKELELFLIDPQVGLGLPMWYPKGALLWRVMEDYWYQEHLKNGYQLVRSPHIGNRVLWETSGHWNFYGGSMYPPMEVGRSLDELKQDVKVAKKEEYLIKPMNCPFHVVLFQSKMRSYRELPCRWAECGTVYRYEKSGELSGLTRVRGFTQDDAHIICSADQVETELKRVIDFITHVFSTFGFKDYQVYLSLRDPKNKEKYAGNDQGWEFTQNVLAKVAKDKGIDYIEEEGEAAFYGPKLDFKIKDVIGREWQCSTLQFDFNLPERFKINFINKNGKEEKPYMLHRVLFGSFERFIGLLIEHYAGAFPVWLSPVQVMVASVGSAHNDFCLDLVKKLTDNGIRAEAEIENETVGNKIRNAEKQKIPYMLVIGDQEVSGGPLAVRVRGQKQMEKLAIEQFIARIKEEIANKK